MRFIPTPTVAVEKLKQQAKKTKAKLRIPHSDALDRVARGAGYNHWGHVTWCAKESERLQDAPDLLKECRYITGAALAGKGKVVVTGPEILDRPLILFSTHDGDAWMLEPNELYAMCLCWRGEALEAHVRISANQVEIGWDGEFEIVGQAFKVSMDNATVGTRAIHGYPVQEIREAMFKVESFDKRMREVFTERQTLPLTPTLIEQLVEQGWERERLAEAAAAGAEYSPQRNSFFFPMEFSAEDD